MTCRHTKFKNYADKRSQAKEHNQIASQSIRFEY